MRVLLIGPLPPPVTGQGVANEYLRAGLELKLHDVQVINTGAQAKIEDSTEQGRLHFRKFLYVLNEILTHFKQVWSSKAQIAYITPGQTFLGYYRFVPYRLLCSLRGIPVVLHFHGGYFRQMYSSLDPLRRFLTRWTLRHCARIIVLGESLRSLFKGIVANDLVAVCENGIDESLILSDSEIAAKIQRRQKSQEIRVLFLSNIMRTKGILDLLEAVAILIARGVNISCDVAGAVDPTIEREFLKSLRQLGDRVSFHGVVRGARKRALLEKADIFCLPTYYPVEGQPISILEAYGTGCLVVCTDHAGIKDIFRDGENGYYCKAQNPSSVAEKLCFTHQMPTNLIRTNRDLAERLYTATAFTERVELVLARSLAKADF